jgi:thiol-disulfide isomerase/thioredoxin
MIEVVLQLLLLAQTPSASQTNAIDVLKAAKNAVIGAQSVSYVVIRDYEGSSGKKQRGQTNVLIVKDPFQFRAEHLLDGEPVSETAISVGETTFTINGGKLEKNSTFGPGGPSISMVITGEADADVAITWHLLLDPAYIERAITSGRVLYLWEEEIQGEPCSVIVYARDHWTDYFWISTKTGLPRATQRVTMRRGPTRLSARFEIADIRLNPRPSDAFRLPDTLNVAPETLLAAPPPRTPETPPDMILHFVGLDVPSLELRDMQFKARLLSDLNEKPTLITFWAPWCAPCREELAALSKIQARPDAAPQIFAVGVQDRRQKVLDFVQGHKDYNFLFFTDPDMERETSALGSFFHFDQLGVPITVFADRHGKIIDSWEFEGEEALRQRLQKLIQPTPNSR